MLDGKDYSNIDMVFPFIAAFLDRVLQNSESPCLTEINTLYSDTVNQLMYRSFDGDRAEYSTENL